MMEVAVLSFGGVPKSQKVQQIFCLQESVAIQVKAGGMPTPAVVDVGHGVEIDRSDVRTTCKHKDSPIVADSIGKQALHPRLISKVYLTKSGSRVFGFYPAGFRIGSGNIILWLNIQS